MIRILTAILLLPLFSCTKVKVIYEDEKVKIEGVQVDLSYDYDRTKPAPVIFRNLRIHSDNRLISDSLEANYAFYQNAHSKYIYLLDTFPVDKDWGNKFTEVVRWNLNYLDQPTQILNHSKITDYDIQTLADEVEQMRQTKKNHTPKEIQTLLKKLYILNLRCCDSSEIKKYNASNMLRDLEDYQVLDSKSRELQNRLIVYLKEAD
ncbi:MAG: hypothetical protein ACJASM_003180 [Salibacteraceae bacterium]|jgi:hypothetical protein